MADPTASICYRYFSMYMTILLFCVIASVTSINPGAEILLTQSGLTYAKNVGIDILKQQIATVKIPDVSGSETLYGYKLSQIKITGFSVPEDQSTVTILPGHGVKAEMRAVSVALSGHYDAYVGTGIFKITKSGSVQMTGTVNSATVYGIFGAKGGRPTISASGCSTDIGKINVKFIGNIFDQIVDLFSGLIDNYIKGELNGVLCSLINGLLNNNCNGFFQKIPIDEKLPIPIPGTDFHINYEMIDAPVFGSDFMRLDLKGECYSQTAKSPIVAPAVAAFKIDPSVMVYIPLTTYVLDTAGYAVLKSGIITQTLTPEDVDKIAPGSGKYFQTTCPGSVCIGSIVPAIGKAYPNTTLNLRTKDVGTAPNFTINSLGTWLNADANVDFVTEDTDTSILNMDIGVKAIVMDLKFTTKPDSYVISGQTHTAGATVALKNTTIPQLTQTDLQNNYKDEIWKLALLTLVDNELNTVFSAGVTIPAIPYVQLYNIKFQTLQNTLVVSGDVKYLGEDDESWAKKYLALKYSKTKKDF